MPVTSKNPTYEKHLSMWQKTRDAVAGTNAIKAKEKRKIYLPAPDDSSDTLSVERYDQYIKRAVYTNFTARTKNALVGAAFRKKPELEMPTELEYLIDDATGDGLSLEQLAKDELSNLLETGRGFFLVDFPQTDDGLSVEQVQVMQLQASIVPYVAEQVINWKTTVINGRKYLSLVVLEESYLQANDEFSHESKIQQRVLRLREDGYTQQIYRDEMPYSEEFYPLKGDGQKWDMIPGVFVGSQNNDSTIDDAPLSDIAEVNIAHYRNSADFEESCFLTGQPTLFITHSLSMEQWTEYNPGGIKLGSRAGHVLGDTGSATLLQADANSLVGDAMIKKESQMVAIGARIITDRTGNETAEGARIRFASENSVLGDLVGNLSNALEQCIKWCGVFMNTQNVECRFDINREFYDKSVDPQMVMAMITLMDREIIGESDVFLKLKSAGLVEPERTLEEVKQERGDANPLI